MIDRRIFAGVEALLFGCVLGGLPLPGCLAEGQTIQYSSGQCSVNIANVSGNVTVEGGCMDQKVVALFLDTINQQQKNYQEKATEVELWIKRYDELSARLGTSGAFSQLREEVKRRFKEGDLEGAGRAKDQIIAGEEGLVDELATDYFDRAEILVLQLKPMEAQRFYAKAFQYRPENNLYAEAYARNLCDTNQRDKAQTIYQISANELRSLAKVDPAKYAPALSCTLVDIAGLYFESGAYPQARIAAEEALTVAHSIIPQDGREAQEHIADALTSCGIIALKQGDFDGSEAKLIQAEKIFSDINVTNSNRPILFEALANIAKEKNNKKDEENKITQAVMFEEALTRTEPLKHRSKLAMRLHLLVDFYQSEKDFAKAHLVQAQFANFVLTLSIDDQNTLSFLSGTSSEILCGLLVMEGNIEKARPSCLSAVKTLEGIKSSLRPKESTILSSAYDEFGWLKMVDAEYHSASEAFDNAVRANLDIDGAQSRRAAADRRIAQFFVADFPSAGKDILSHSDNMSNFDRGMWDFIIRKRTDPGARLETTASQGKAEVERILVDVASGRLPASLLKGAISRISSTTDLDERCRLIFYTGELLVLEKERSQGLDTFSRCNATVGGGLYSWVVASEKVYWSKQN